MAQNQLFKSGGTKMRAEPLEARLERVRDFLQCVGVNEPVSLNVVDNVRDLTITCQTGPLEWSFLFGLWGEGVGFELPLSKPIGGWTSLTVGINDMADIIQPPTLEELTERVKQKIRTRPPVVRKLSDDLLAVRAHLPQIYRLLSDNDSKRRVADQVRQNRRHSEEIRGNLLRSGFE
jgi:hypothetical protein